MIFTNVLLGHRSALLVLTLVMLTLCRPGGQESPGAPSQAPRPSRWIEISPMAVAYDSPAVNDLTFITPEKGWLLTHSQLLATEDGGRRWEERYTGGGKRFFSKLLFGDAKSGWIVGSALTEGSTRALILHTADGGRSWVEQPVAGGTASSSGARGGLHGLSRCGAALWALGDTGIVRASNDGRKWETQYVSGDGRRLFDIACANPERVVAVGSGGAILHSRDGGASWDVQTGGVDTQLRVRYFNGKFWVVGGGGVILRADVDALKWERLTETTSEALYDIYMNGDEGWVVGENGTILYTANGGDAWQKQSSPTESTLTSLSFLDADHGWAGGQERTLLRRYCCEK